MGRVLNEPENSVDAEQRVCDYLSFIETLDAESAALKFMWVNWVWQCDESVCPKGILLKKNEQRQKGDFLLKYS